MAIYSVSVALFDYVPVAFTAVGLAFLARGISRQLPAWAALAWSAALLIPLGGACKASWKLLMAVQQTDIGWLENLLFILMAPGFVIIAGCLRAARLAWQGSGRSPALTPLAICVALTLALAWLAHHLVPESRLWFFWLLGVTTLANIALMLQALLAARQARLDWTVSACLVYNFAATLALSGLSRLPPGETTAWIQEGVNFSAQAALAWAFFRLGRRMQEPL